ncbi:MAG: site-specific integrase [Actinomycetota bacterium]
MRFDGANFTGTDLIGRRFPRETLTDAECRDLLDQCSRRSATGIRNRALIVLLWRAGLRISEALDLRASDINPDAGMVTVLRGKGGKRRDVPLDSGAMAEVLLWRKYRESLPPLRGRRVLICTLKEGKPISAGYVRQLLRRLAAGADIEKRVTPHTFRHTYAAELAAINIPMPEIRDALGHGSLATTDAYLRELHPSLDRLRAREPLVLS